MNKPKSAVEVDAERLVRDLLDAFSSLKAIAATATGATASSDEQQQPPARVREDRDRASEDSGELAVAISASAELPLEAEPPCETLTEPVSDIGSQEQEEQVPEFQRAASPASTSDRIEAPKTQRELIDEFRADREVLQRFQVTPEELRALSRVSMLGIMTSKQDLLFILRQIREAASPKILEETDLSEPELVDVPDERPEQPPSVTAQMTEHIRREALLKLPGWQKQRDAERRRAQLGCFLSAIGSVAAKAGRRAITTLKS